MSRGARTRQAGSLSSGIVRLPLIPRVALGKAFSAKVSFARRMLGEKQRAKFNLVTSALVTRAKTNSVHAPFCLLIGVGRCGHCEKVVRPAP